MHLFTAAALTYAAPRTPSAFMQDDYLSFTSRHSLVGNGTRLAWVEKLRGTEKMEASETHAWPKQGGLRFTQPSSCARSCVLVWRLAAIRPATMTSASRMTRAVRFVR